MGKKKGKKSDKQPSESGDSASGTAAPKSFEKPEATRDDDFPPVGGSVWGRGRGRGGVQTQRVVEEPPVQMPPGGRGQRVGGGDFEGPGLENITKGRGGGRGTRGRGVGRGGAGDGPSPPPVQLQQHTQRVDEPEQGLPPPRKTSGPRHPGQQVPPPGLQQPPQQALPVAATPQRWGAPRPVQMPTPQPVQMPTPQQGPPGFQLPPQQGQPGAAPQQRWGAPHQHVQMPGPQQGPPRLQEPRMAAPQQIATTVPEPPHPHPSSQGPPSESQPPPKKVPPPDSIEIECSAMETEDGDVAKITTALSQAKLTPPSGSGNGSHLLIPHRKKIGPIVGTKGRKILIEVNHLQLQLRKTNAIAIHYDVAFKPELPKKLLRFAMEAFRKRHFPRNYPAFDGRKNLYSCGYLPFKHEIRDTVVVMDEERQRDKEFDITIKYASEVDMSALSTYAQSGRLLPQEAIQALDIVLRNPASMNFTAVGRSFFTPPTDRIIDLGDGLELWYGFYQSAILGWKPYLNIDVAHKGFPKAQHLVEFMVNLRGEGRGGPELLRTPLEPWEKQNLEKFLKGLKLEYQITNQPNTKRTYKVNSVKGPCSSERFKMENGSEMTVGEYFAREKRVPLRFPAMPCIHVGNDQKTIYVPLEFCRIPAGQVVHSKLNETQTANMVKAAAKPADERKRRIMDAMRQANFNADKCIQEFGITVSQEFTKIDARILDPPKLEYSNNECIIPSKGVWRPSRFLKSNSLKEWKILNLDQRTRDDALWNFADMMNKIGRRLGIAIDKPVDVRTVNLGRQVSKQPIIDYFEISKTTQLIVVVINDRDPGIYAKVKQAAELNVGVLTQCIKSKTMFKMNDATCSNILLKVNSKLNGVNHQIDRSCRPKIFSRPVMIVGADVTHPSPDQKTIPSVAAVAASHDPAAFQYNMLWRLQPPRQEMIEDLEEMMKIQLKFFYKRTKHKPEKIVFYRDGVSEGQFSQVLDVELKAIRRACSAIDATFKPPITFLVVQKRHHTRFFPTNPRDEDGRNKNVPAGTIVDTEITHPREMDFYLVSHASLQGTSRPTKYHKLWDDNDIDENDLEELTYYLCHLFSRCTRSVSYPAPTYYAHLAAFRARSYIEGSPISMTNLPNEQRQRTIQTAIVENSPMFFV